MLKKGKLLLVICFVLLLTISFILPVVAQPSQSYLEYAQPEQVSQPNLFWELVKIVLALAFVLVTTYLVFHFLSKRNPLLARSNFINVIESSYLAPNRSISIVEVGNKFLVLGVTEQRINLLAEINDQQVVALLKEKNEVENKEEIQDSFANQLAGFLGSLGASGSSKESVRDGKSDVQLHKLRDYFTKQIQEIKVIPGDGNSKMNSKEHNKEKDEL